MDGRDWYNQTTLHPLGLGAVLVLGALMLVLPRRYAVVPMFVMACFVPPAQRLVVASLDFDLLRIMVVFGWTRLILFNEFRGFRWTSVDSVVVVWSVVGVVVMTLQKGTTDALVNRLGWMFDATGLFFLFRCLVRDMDDVRRLISWVCMISVPVAIAFLIEHTTRRNVFSVLGGVPEITGIRDGRLRCQGAYAHPILAGCFWASLLPLMATGWWGTNTTRLKAVIGVVCGLIVIYACASSTPVVGVGVAIVGACMFPLRRWMPIFRWGALAALVGLHLVMKAPVWHLLARVKLVGGSTGWHRYKLIDEAIGHLGEWWLIGTKSTSHWGRQMHDVTNQYVLEGVQGGLVRLALFVTMIVLLFRALGRMMHRCQGDRYPMIILWALGVSLAVHCVSYLAISYYGQITMLWFMLLATITSLSANGVLVNEGPRVVKTSRVGFGAVVPAAGRATS